MDKNVRRQDAEAQAGRLAMKGVLKDAFFHGLLRKRVDQNRSQRPS